MSSMPISERLRFLRKKHNLTQQNIADYLHITRQGYSHYENGTRVPDVHTLTLLADLYNITLGEMLNSSENSEFENSGVESGDFGNAGDTSGNSEGIQGITLKYVVRGLSSKEKMWLKNFSQLTFEQQNDFLDLLRVKQYRQRLRKSN